MASKINEILPDRRFGVTFDSELRFDQRPSSIANGHPAMSQTVSDKMGQALIQFQNVAAAKLPVRIK